MLPLPSPDILNLGISWDFDSLLSSLGLDASRFSTILLRASGWNCCWFRTIIYGKDLSYNLSMMVLWRSTNIAEEYCG